MTGGLRSEQRLRSEIDPERAQQTIELADPPGPPLSVVLAARDAAIARRWLDNIQIPPSSPIQIVVVGPGPDSDYADGDHVIGVEASASALTPHLWARGIARAAGEAVALTIADCRPADNWLAAILGALDAMPSVAALGGAIDLDPRGSPADWALYFLRYSAYMPPLAGGRVAEIAADNAVYRRSALDRFPESWRLGFWEPSVHARFRQDGLALALDPRIVVVHRHSLTVAQFSRQRFLHGWAFGSARFASGSIGRRALRALAAPAAAVVLTARVVRRVMAKRRHRLRLVASLPFLVWFVLCWIVGETVGSLIGQPQWPEAEFN